MPEHFFSSYQIRQLRIWLLCQRDILAQEQYDSIVDDLCIVLSENSYHFNMNKFRNECHATYDESHLKRITKEA